MSTCFVTSFDEKYYNISMVAVKSLGENSQDKIDLVCLVPPSLMHRQDEYANAIGQKNLNISFRCDQRFVDTYDDDMQSGYITISCNHRIFIASICQEYSKAIYFDPDTIILRDLSPIINYKFNTIISALQEFSDMNVNTFNNPDRPYFNNGVFIVNLDKWRDNDIESKLLGWQHVHGITSCPEQDAMNAILVNDWTPMPVSFNAFAYLYQVNQVFASQNSNPMIVHFVGPDKPWNSPEGKYRDVWLNKFNSIHENT